VKGDLLAFGKWRTPPMRTSPSKNLVKEATSNVSAAKSAVGKGVVLLKN
jgi:hypothetical protein